MPRLACPAAIKRTDVVSFNHLRIAARKFAARNLRTRPSLASFPVRMFKTFRPNAWQRPEAYQFFGFR